MAIHKLLKSAVDYTKDDSYYHIPSYGKRKTVKVGQTVSLIFSDGRREAWVATLVTAKSVARYTGTIRSNPWNIYRVFPKGVRRGDSVSFLPKHIAEIVRT